MTFFKFKLLQNKDLLDGGGSGNPPEGNNPPGGNNPPEGNNSPPTEIPDWAQGVEFPKDLDPSIAHDPSIKVFLGEDKKLNYANLMKSYVHAQKQIGKERLLVPGKDSPPESWEQFFQKIGRPEAPDKYEVNLKKDATPVDDKFLEGFKAAAHKAGLIPSQVQKMAEFFQDQVDATAKSVMEAEKGEKAAAEKVLKEEFGEKFEQNIKVANLALQHFGGKELSQALKEYGMANDPTVIKFLVKVGEILSDDQIKDLGVNPDNMSPADLQSEVDLYVKDLSGPYYNSDHPEHNSVKAKVQKLFERMSVSR